MNHKEYNGWYNYETWLVKLWLDNDESSYHEVKVMARHTMNAAHLANQLRALVDGMAYQGVREGGSLQSDLIGAAMAEVNFDEIANSYMEEVVR